MSIFSSLFGNSENQNLPVSKVNWISLTNILQLLEISERSFDKPVLIFKHSTRCSVSRMVLKQFESEFDVLDEVTPYLLDLLEYRTVSDEIAARFEVVHQSPQLLLIKDGKVVYTASHESISIAGLHRNV